ncbi:MAG: TolC family protein [Hyphomonas sp.]|uniref:TolC family protein n=1 Tax=Hyphomonas sp. TaxID=87 RepID=UPI00352841AC
MKRLFLAATAICASLFALPAFGQSAPIVDIMEQSVRTSPAYLAADADLGRAAAAADRIAAGPYEFEVNASGGQRKIDNPLASDESYTEWSAGVARTVRLPKKREADYGLARIENELARASLDQVLQAERRHFAMLWSAWRQAELMQETSSVQADEARRIAELEQVAVDKGAQRQIRADQLAAEAGLLFLQAEQDRNAAEAARAALVARYPDTPFPERAFALDWSDENLQQVLAAPLDQTPAYRKSRLEAEQAQLRARRTRMDALPDPTLGLDFGNEFGGSETSLMARITIPIGGSARRAYSREMSANATVAELNRVGVERETYQAVEAARVSLRASLSMYETALATAAASEKYLGTMRKGYELSEITITEFLNSRRSTIAAERAVAEQRAKVESDLLTLMVMTGSLAETDG